MFTIDPQNRTCASTSSNASRNNFDHTNNILTKLSPNLYEFRADFLFASLYLFLSPFSRVIITTNHGVQAERLFSKLNSQNSAKVKPHLVRKWFKSNSERLHLRTHFHKYMFLTVFKHCFSLSRNRTIRTGYTANWSFFSLYLSLNPRGKYLSQNPFPTTDPFQSVTTLLSPLLDDATFF